MTLLLPDRYSWRNNINRTPVYGSWRLDRKNSLNRDAMFAMMGTDPRWETGLSGDRRGTDCGLSVTSESVTNGGGAWHQERPWNTNGELTVAWLGRDPNGASEISSFGMRICIAWEDDATWTAPFAAFLIQHQGTNAVSLQVGWTDNTGTLRTAADSNAGFVADGQVHCYHLTISGVTCRLWADGVLATTLTFTSSFANLTNELGRLRGNPINVFNRNLKTPDEGTYGAFYSAAFYARAWTDEEIRRHAQDYWQIFVPSRLLSYPGPRVVSNSVIAAIESAAGVSREAIVAIETLRGVDVTVVSGVEALQTTAVGTLAAIESLMEAAVTVRSAFEALGVVNQTAVAAIEAGGLVAITQSAVAEIEALQGVSLGAGAGVEALGGVQRSLLAPFEALGLVSRSAGSSVESLEDVRGTVVIPFEALGFASATAQAAIEALLDPDAMVVIKVLERDVYFQVVKEGDVLFQTVLERDVEF